MAKLSNAIIAASYSSLQINERALQDLQGKVKGQVRDDGEPVCLHMLIHSVSPPKGLFDIFSGNWSISMMKIYKIRSLSTVQSLFISLMWFDKC